MNRLKLGILALIIMISIPIYSFANTLTLNMKVDKEEIKIGDEIKITVSWDKEMQAADFYLNYNSKKLEFVTCNVDELFVNNNAEEGKIKTSWVSLDDSNKTEIEYTFKVKKGGKAKFTTTIDGGFATGELEVPTQYNNGELLLKITGDYTIIYVLSIIIITITIIFIKKFIGRN